LYRKFHKIPYKRKKEKVMDIDEFSKVTYSGPSRVVMLSWLQVSGEDVFKFSKHVPL